jgi:hypothetical protein
MEPKRVVMEKIEEIARYIPDFDNINPTSVLNVPTVMQRFFHVTSTENV